MDESLLNSRRSFLKQGLFATAGLLLTGPQVLAARHQEVLVLHTNDVHSRLDPFPNDGSKYAGKGGIAARKRLIDQLRKQNQHTLLLDCGDIFQGTPYFNFYKGEPEIKAMQLLGYQAATMGNHDFDEGVVNFANQLRHAEFPILVANYEVTATPLMGKIKPFKIFTFDKIKIGVVGIGIELAGLVPQSLFGDVRYLDPITHANQYAQTLKINHQCDAVVIISHLGYQYGSEQVSDVKLAENSQHIDVILGGHTHTFLEKAVFVKNKQGRDVLINQVGFGGLRLGQVKLIFDRVSKKIYTKTHNSWV